MEWTKTEVISTLLSKLYVFSNHFDNVCVFWICSKSSSGIRLLILITLRRTLFAF